MKKKNIFYVTTMPEETQVSVADYVCLDSLGLKSLKCLSEEESKEPLRRFLDLVSASGAEYPAHEGFAFRFRYPDRETAVRAFGTLRKKKISMDGFVRFKGKYEHYLLMDMEEFLGRVGDNVDYYVGRTVLEAEKAPAWWRKGIPRK